MADGCLLDIVDGIVNSCAIPGGLNKRLWIGNRDEWAFTYDTDGYIDTVTPVGGSPVPTLFKFIGKNFKHNYTNEGAVGENLNTINPTLNAVLNVFTPAERKAAEDLFKAEDLIAFVQRNGADGATVIEVMGIENGLTGSALTGGSGTLLNDSTAITVSLSGEETTLPKVIKSSSLLPTDQGYLADNITYLDNLSA